MSCRQLNLYGAIGSGYVFDCNRPLTSYTKTKMALSDVHMMFIHCRMVVVME
jgi:hypothetical protein